MLRPVAGAVALVLAIVFALLPLERQTIEYAWNPATDGASTPLLLIERTPDRFELRFPCSAEADDDEVLFTSSASPSAVPALTVRSVDDEIRAEVPAAAGDPTGPRRGVGLPFGTGAGCDIEVLFDRSSSRLSLSSGDGSAHIDIGRDEAFELTGLHWSAGTEDVSALIRTTPFSAVRNSTAQKATLSAIVLLAAVAAGTSLRRRIGWRPPRGWWRLRRSELAMAGVLVVVVLIDLPRVDDGRILARARSLSGAGLMGNVEVMLENSPMPQRWLYEWFIGNTVGASSVIPVLRSFSLAAFIVAWMLLRRRVLPQLDPSGSRAVVVAAWIVHAVGAVAWAATLRPEPLILLLLTAVLAVLASWPLRTRPWPYFALASCVGLAVATHINGLVVAFAGAVAVPTLWRQARARWRPALTGTTWGATLAVIAVFIGSNLRHAHAAVTKFPETDHSLGVLDALHYLDQASASTSPMMLLFALSILATGALVLEAVRRSERRSSWGQGDLVVFGGAVAPFALLLSPSKWIWHLAVLVPVAVLGTAVVVRRLGRHDGRAVALVVLTATVGLATAWSLRPAWRARTLLDWEVVALRRVTPEAWSDRLPLLIGPRTSWALWVALLLAVALAVRAVQRRRRRAGGPAAAAAVLGLVATFVSFVQLSPPVVDAVVSGGEWTFVRQSVVGVWDRRASCGVLGAPTDGPATGGPLIPEGARVISNARAGLLVPCHTLVHQRDGAWQRPVVMVRGPSANQRRLLLEYDASPVGCDSFPRARAEDRLCFSSLRAPAEPLAPASVSWSTTAAPARWKAE